MSSATQRPEDHSPEALAMFIQGALINQVEDPRFPVHIQGVEHTMHTSSDLGEIHHVHANDQTRPWFIVVSASGQRIKVTVEPEWTCSGCGAVQPTKYSCRMCDYWVDR